MKDQTVNYNELTLEELQAALQRASRQIFEIKKAHQLKLLNEGALYAVRVEISGGLTEVPMRDTNSAGLDGLDGWKKLVEEECDKSVLSFLNDWNLDEDVMIKITPLVRDIASGHTVALTDYQLKLDRR